MDDFFCDRLGRKDAFTSDMEWFGISEQYLAEVTNGEVFRDDVGLFSSIREKLRQRERSCLKRTPMSDCRLPRLQRS